MTIISTVPPRRITFMDPAPWMSDAACADERIDPELFHPEDDSPRAPMKQRRRVLQAKAVCASCPVQLTCAAYAMERPELSGIWGGITGSERRRLHMKYAS